MTFEVEAVPAARPQSEQQLTVNQVTSAQVLLHRAQNLKNQLQRLKASAAGPMQSPASSPSAIRSITLPGQPVADQSALPDPQLISSAKHRESRSATNERAKLMGALGVVRTVTDRRFEWMVEPEHMTADALRARFGPKYPWMTGHELEGLAVLFKRWDTNGSGLIEIDEFAGAAHNGPRWSLFDIRKPSCIQPAYAMRRGAARRYPSAVRFPRHRQVGYAGFQRDRAAGQFYGAGHEWTAGRRGHLPDEIL